VTDNNKPFSSALSKILIGLAGIGSLVLMGWFLVVLLDLKHLNTSGFTLP
jgi:hypothetical protein